MSQGAYGFKLNDKYYVTYNSSNSQIKDGGLGSVVTDFCFYVNRNHLWDFLKRRVSKLKLVGRNTVPKKRHQKYYSELTELDDDDKANYWPCLLEFYDFGEILWGIMIGDVKHIIDDFEFLTNGLDCEYAYIIDLDKMTLDLYRGGKGELDFSSGRPILHRDGETIELLPYDLPFPLARGYRGYPVQKRCEFPLSGVPRNWLEQDIRRFLHVLEGGK